MHLILIANQEGQFFAGLDDRLAVAGRTASAPRPIQRPGGSSDSGEPGRRRPGAGRGSHVDP